VSVTLSGCTSEKARSLRLAAVQFKNESLAAIEAIEAMHQRELAPPARSPAQVRSEFINNILEANSEISEQDVELAINPDAPTLDSTTQEPWQVFINKMNAQYEALAAIYDEVEGGSLLASKAVQKSAEHAKNLTLQMAAFATVIDKHPPMLIQERIIVVADLDTLRQEYQQKKQTGESNENLQPLRDKAGELLDKWQQIAINEQKLRDTTVAQCLKAAVLGKDLTQLIERYDKLDLDDLNSIIARVLDTAAAITGRDYASLKTKAANIFTEIRNDEIWSKAANTVLKEVSKTVAGRNSDLTSKSSATRGLQGSKWLEISPQKDVVVELKLLTKGIVTGKTSAIKLPHDYLYSATR
jgi:hypothetical protein